MIISRQNLLNQNNTYCIKASKVSKVVAFKDEKKSDIVNLLLKRR